jgi:surface carbohydrate biosynthesis protein
MNLTVNNKLTIVLPIEVKKRELFSKIFLAYQILKKINCKIIIGSQRNMFNNIISLKNVIWLDKNTYFKKIIKNKFLKKNIKFLLDEEGPSFFNGIFYKLRINKNIINFFDEIFVWGKNDYNLFKKKKKLHIFGHPKYDILKNKKFFFFKNESKKIKTKYKKFILIVSNFGQDSILDKKIENRVLEINATNKKYSIEKQKLEKIEYINYISQINLTKIIAKELPDVKIIYRPHPYQNIDLVKKRFGKISKNLEINYNGSITPWIESSKIYIHSGCSTFFEANLLKKPILFFYKKKMNNFLTFKNSGKNFNDEELLIKYLKYIFYKKNISIKHYNKFNKCIFNLKKENCFYINFVDLIKKKYIHLKSEVCYVKNQKKKISSNILSYIKNNIILKTSLVKFLPEKYLYPKEYQLSKFDHLKKKEIKNYFLELNSKFYKKIRFFEINKDVFELSLK